MMFKKFRKAYRIFFPAVFSPQDEFENKLHHNPEISHFELQEDSYSVTLKNGIRLKIRNHKFSDIWVFQQIFNFKEYDIIQKLLLYNNIATDGITMIDAGANVGYTTIFLAEKFKSARIFAVEPSASNATMFEGNVQNLIGAEVKLYKRALCYEEGMSFSINRDFRDGQDWSITTDPDPEGVIKGITLPQIIRENNLSHITFLKIDIEGAERFIFADGNDFSFLKITKVLALEIHDEFNIRESIYDILKANGFFLIESGEITIGINRNLFKV